jgi:pantoate--beta-alanine ligase
MGIYTNQQSLELALRPFRQNGTLGFVPTMGALHRGHLELVKRALEENSLVVVSIFVNPTQFDNANDLAKYPRDLDKDVALIKSVSDNIIVFAPTAEELYNNEIKPETFDFQGLDRTMEGNYRTGHFDGVATVVSLLLHLIQPDKAYFGEKDFQQLQIVKKLVATLHLGTNVVGCPIVREANGLALSSRNQRLSPQQFDAASLIYRTLCDVRDKFASHTIAELHQLVTERFLKSNDITLEYFEIAEENNLQPLENLSKSGRYRAFIAAYAGEIRLIDNMALN